MQVGHLLVACLALALASAAHPALAVRLLRQDGGPAALVSNVQVQYYYSQNLQGDTIIADAHSLLFKGSHPYFYGMSGPNYDTPDKCFAVCARTTGCNAFVSCAKPGGCGAGCKNWVSQHPKLPSNFDDMNYNSQPLPILAFGAWTYPVYDTDGCANTTAESSDTGDKWAWGLCSLKVLSDTANPQFYTPSNGYPENEFDSGVLQKPADCPDGLPYSICARCNALGDDNKWACLDCASALKLNNPVREATSPGEQGYDWCPKCFSAGKMSTTDCLQCVKDKGNGGDVYNCA